MQGPEGVAELVRGWVEQRLPARLRIIETDLDLAPGSLANPTRVLSHEVGPIALEDWPSVYVLPQRQAGMALVDVNEDAGETYRVTYALTVLAWVRADGYAATDTLRKRYALAIRETLLERKTLAPPEHYAAGNPHAPAAVIPTSLREDYSEVMTDEAKRTIAGVSVSVDVLLVESTLPPPALGSVAALDVRTKPDDTADVPPHPAL
jgi:hypothetical protein